MQTSTTQPTVLTAWLDQVLGEYTITPLQGDASTRLYYRIQHQSNSLIAMYDPPQKRSLNAFLSIADHLDQLRLPIPKRLAFDCEQGCLLQQDLGSTTLLRHLNQDNTLPLYQQALSHLKTLQQGDPGPLKARPDHAWLDEARLFASWFCQTHCHMPLDANEQTVFETALSAIAQAIAAQPQVPVHRDYHSRNLMWYQDQLYIIDFQDAILGPIGYDIISLLNDYYTVLSPHHYQTLLQQAWQSLLPKTPFEQFDQWVCLTGAQRHLKNLGNFARLIHQGGKPQYQQDLAQIMNYLINLCMQEKQLQPLIPMLETRKARL